MESVFQLVGIALIAGVAALILRGTRPELAFAVTVAGGIILLLFVFDAFSDAFSVLRDIAEATGVDASVIRLLLKILGIGYLVQFGADALCDFGQNSLADKLVFCGKLLILVLSIPILESLLSLIRKVFGMI